MGQQANVGSIDAIAAFRARLLVYASKARPAVEEVSSEIMRTKLWLENEQRMRWEAAIRERRKKLEAAEHELYSSRLAQLKEPATAQVAAVNRLKRSVEEAENKLKIIKRWTREFESRVEPLVKQLEKLHTFLSHDLAGAGAHLAEVIKMLDAYAGTGPAPAVARGSGGGASSAAPEIPTVAAEIVTPATDSQPQTPSQPASDSETPAA
jgi:predicted RNase H-like nuclease (RuvC/YqgF family)